MALVTNQLEHGPGRSIAALATSRREVVPDDRFVAVISLRQAQLGCRYLVRLQATASVNWRLVVDGFAGHEVVDSGTFIGPFSEPLRLAVLEDVGDALLRLECKSVTGAQSILAAMTWRPVEPGFSPSVEGDR